MEPFLKIQIESKDITSPPCHKLAKKDNERRILKHLHKLSMTNWIEVPLQVLRTEIASTFDDRRKV